MRDVLEIALSVMEGLDCARSLTVAILLREGEYDQIVGLTTDPCCYTTPTAYFQACAATDFLRKLDGLPTTIDTEAKAREKWWKAERDCKLTNDRLNDLFSSGYPDENERRLRDFFARLRKTVSWLIGDCPPSTWEGAFGPGATVSDPSRYTTVPDKMSSVPTFTPEAWPFLFPWAGTEWAKASAALGNSPLSYRGNKYFTVPKDSSTRRSCAKEPSLNGFFQLGLGRVMRRRLALRGLDLVNGQDTHRLVACRASKGAGLATIDLSSASDTISLELVKLAFPDRWVSNLMALRSPYTQVDGKWVLLEKFSSMGNGFTFELETALFAAILLTLDPTLQIGEDLWVYGDDIIVPSRLENEVKACFAYLGFTLNPKKSYFSGEFRESCGGDYFRGVWVRPYFLKELPHEPQHFIALANGIRKLGRCEAFPHSIRDSLRRAWFRCLDHIPTAIRSCRGPEDLGDLVIHDDQERWDTRWRSCIRYVRCYRPAQYRKVRWNGFAYDVQFAAALYGVSVEPKRSIGSQPLRADALSERERYLIPRDGVDGYKVGWVPFS